MYFSELDPIADSGLLISRADPVGVPVPKPKEIASPAASDAYATGSPLDTEVSAPRSPKPLVVAGDIFPPEDTEKIHDEMQDFIDSINEAVEELTRLEEAISDASVKQEIREKIESLKTIAGKLEKQISGDSEKPIRSIEEWQEVKSTLLDPEMQETQRYIESFKKMQKNSKHNQVHSKQNQDSKR